MNRFKMLLIAAALMTGGSVLASAQPNDHGRRGDGDRDRSRYEDRDHGRDRRFDRDDHRNYGEVRALRDGDDGRRFDRDDYRYRVGERRFFNGYYWTWDGSRWGRRDRGVSFYFSF